MLHAAFVRSPHAHARLGAINADRALKVPGVVAVVTGADLGEAGRSLPIVPPHAALRGQNFRLLASDRARFVGEAVAVVVAESRNAAEDGRAQIDVDWEPLPSVQDPTAPGPVRVHEDIPDNLAGRVTLSRGQVATALDAAPRRASLTLRIGRAGGQPMETRGLVAEYNTVTELLTVWASSQVPHQVRQFICDLLALEPHRVRVVAPDVGGGFGAKLIVYPEDVLIPFLALRFGRPVRWLEDRLEHMLTATQERTQVHAVEIGFDDEGRLLALRDRFVHDTGAYTPRGLVVPLLSASMLAGPYRIPNVEVTFDSVYTHRVPVTPYRGAGQPQAVFVIERVMDLIARETGRDRRGGALRQPGAGSRHAVRRGPAELPRLRPRDLRQRRLSGRAPPRARDGRLRASGPGMSRCSEGWPTARRRRRVLRRVDRRGAVRGRDRPRRRRGAADGLHGRTVAGPGSRDDAGPDRRGRAGRDAGGGHDRRWGHARHRAGRGDVRQPGRGGGWHRGRAGRARAARQGRASGRSRARRGGGRDPAAGQELHGAEQSRAPDRAGSGRGGGRDGHRRARRGARARGDALLSASRHRVLRRRPRRARRGRSRDAVTCGCAATG